MEHEKLRFEIMKRGLKKNAIAKALMISPKTFCNKLNGTSSFTWDEVSILHKQFFPDVPKEQLMQR